MRQNQHRPAKEPRKDPRTLLARVERAIDLRQHGVFVELLEQLDKSSEFGNWGHRVLGLVLTQHTLPDRAHWLRALLACRQAPKPTENSDFITLALKQPTGNGAMECVPLLLDAGFSCRAEDELAERLCSVIAEGAWPYPARIAPALAHTHPERLAKACLLAMDGHLVGAVQTPGKLDRAAAEHLVRLDGLWETVVDRKAPFSLALLGGGRINPLGRERTMRLLPMTLDCGWTDWARLCVARDALAQTRRAQPWWEEVLSMAQHREIAEEVEAPGPTRPMLRL